MSYEPRPDTVAFRALAHMELLHKGSEIPSGTLAHALGIETNTLIACLEPAIKARAIFRRQKGGHIRSPIFWSLVDHSKRDTPQGGLTAIQARGKVMSLESLRAPPAEGHVARLLAVPPPTREAAGQSAQPAGKDVSGGHAEERPPADGLDIDQVHRTRDNVIEMECVARPTCDHGATDDRCAQCAADIRAGSADGEPILVGGAAPAVDDAHEHFARSTIDQAAPLPSTPATKPEVKAITSTERPLSVREYIRSIEGAVPPDPPPPAPPTPMPRVRAGTAPARWGIFSDGELHIEKAGQRIVLERAELEAFVAFLERMGEPA